MSLVNILPGELAALEKRRNQLARDIRGQEKLLAQLRGEVEAAKVDRLAMFDEVLTEVSPYLCETRLHLVAELREQVREGGEMFDAKALTRILRDSSPRKEVMMNRQMKLYRSTRTQDLELFDAPPRADGWELVGAVTASEPTVGEQPVAVAAPVAGKITSLERILRAVAKARGEIHDPWQPPVQPTPRRMDALFAINAYRKARDLPPVKTIEEAY